MPAPPSPFPTLGKELWMHTCFSSCCSYARSRRVWVGTHLHKMACDKTCLGPRERREGQVTSLSLSNQVQDMGAGTAQAC